MNLFTSNVVYLGTVNKNNTYVVVFNKSKEFKIDSGTLTSSCGCSTPVEFDNRVECTWNTGTTIGDSVKNLYGKVNGEDFLLQIKATVQ